MNNLKEAENKVNKSYKILYNIEKDIAMKNSFISKIETKKEDIVKP